MLSLLVAGSHEVVALVHGTAEFHLMILFHGIIPGEVVVLVNDGWW
ncbi:hypothetical protein [Laceyella sediminis]|jgi:hypothetical protein|nr:hypothetical protein [Laceyella sediminis]